MLPYWKWSHTSRDRRRGASSILDDHRWLCPLATAGAEMGSQWSNWEMLRAAGGPQHQRWWPVGGHSAGC